MLLYWSCLDSHLDVLLDLVLFSVLTGEGAGLREEPWEQSAKISSKEEAAVEELPESYEAAGIV